MIDKKHINELKSRIEKLNKRGDIFREKNVKFTSFFLKNSNDAFDTAKLLYEVSINNSLNKSLGFSNFNGFLWVINASYYSMFYMARALLETEGIRIKTDFSIHAVVFDALIYYFYLTGKIQKKIIEEFEEAGQEASEILGQEKTKQLMEDYFNEREKRVRFTYELGEIAMKNKAFTSLERAKKFNEELRKIIEF
jgi:uncharacterized protein (UPF0332 family)